MLVTLQQVITTMIYNINKFSNLKFKFRLDEQKLYINRENPNQKKNKNYKFVSLNNEIIIMDNKTYSLDELSDLIKNPSLTIPFFVQNIFLVFL